MKTTKQYLITLKKVEIDNKLVRANRRYEIVDWYEDKPVIYFEPIGEIFLETGEWRLLTK